jgi:hypothetical protein
MKLIHSTSAIILWIVIGIVGFMIYHKDTTLPLADVMGTQVDEINQWDISYQLLSDRLTLSNNSDTLIGTLTIPISYDPQTIKLLTERISSSYEYSFDTSHAGKLTLLINGILKAGEIITIPLEWDSTNISILSPTLINNDSSSSLSITRIE